MMKIGITIGDPAGIGPEIILKSASMMKNIGNLFIFGNKKILKKTALDLGLRSNYGLIKDKILDCIGNITFQYGKPSGKTGRAAMESLKSALDQGVDVLITSPIVKDVIRDFIPGFIGHTEYLARYFKTRNYAMMGLWRNKRIMLLTTHVPMRRIFKTITVRNVLKKIILLDQSTKKYFGVKRPKIGVSSLNPHAFEFSLGEDEQIQKAVIEARKLKIDVSGPYPADSLFNRSFDAFLAMYHDQAMIYLKSKNRGLNFTVGIPIIRLSPLFGAALDIAGKRIADESGFIHAILQGIKIFKNVRKYEKKES
ncbi:MAG TPA: hypothetical protein ENI34_01970 [candidate division WOR-3 bacterium]|uniref:4-hydroxythreonine-4-phosphate dehydrogenase PdxA n=1 Tax=candidate division WOR-3 bacterium TaxID=2052148 RepID=A0A9C9EL17_UNCW3|nr:hypothetical protein [candidate division WOR-3 bacterium]